MTTFNQGTFDAICGLIEDGYSRREACGSFDTLESTFRGWLKQNTDLDAQYARSCEHRAQLWAEQMMEIADNPQIGITRTEKGDGTVEVKHGDMIDHRRLRIDSRKWMMARILPKKYGDKVQQEHSGAVGVTVVRSSIPRPARD